ncbi:MAG: helix-turn-helix transcriptional regulator [Aquincola sp.]|nr:helix-turn-helix transcriptional regulator [Aquincola sp.]
MFSSPPPSVSMTLARVMCDALQHQGLPVDEFHRRTGISPHELAQPGLRLGSQRHERVRALMRLLAPAPADLSAVDRDSLYWHWPEQAALWFNQADAARALEDWLQFRPLVGSTDSVTLQSRDDCLVLTYRPDCEGAGALHSVLANFAIVREMLREHEAAAGPRGLQLRAELAGTGYSRVRLAWQHRLQMPVHAGSEVAAHRLIVRGPALRAALVPHNAWLAERSRQLLHSRLQALAGQPVADDLLSRAEAVLCSLWDASGADPASAHDVAGDDEPLQALHRAVAQALGCSRWTLRRHLASAGLPFADLVERLRARRLAELLPRQDLSLLEVAWRTGFQSASAFSRYHRRRYGVAPSVRRRGLQQAA